MFVSEPRQVVALPLNGSSVRLCWMSPAKGTQESYMVIYKENKDSDPVYYIKKLVTQNNSICVTLGDLTPLQDYWVQIKAVSAQECAIPSSIEFRTVGDPEENGDSGIDDDECTTGRCGRSKIKCSQPDENNKECRCRNKGELMSAGNLPYCRCAAGFVGKFCELRDPCVMNSCQNGGSCISSISGEFRCSCLHGFYGSHCELFNPCSRGLCVHGVCVNKSSSDFDCLCPLGYSGIHCERYDPCVSSPCLNNGICVNQTDTLFTCKCPPGFHGFFCDYYDPCYNDPCHEGGMCNSIDGKYICECDVGRFGSTCEHTNLCLYISPCENFIDCKNTSDTTYKCTCSTGMKKILFQLKNSNASINP